MWLRDCDTVDDQQSVCGRRFNPDAVYHVTVNHRAADCLPFTPSSHQATLRFRMTEPAYICKTSEIPPGTSKELVVAGRVIALFNVNGEFHAMDGICPHAGGPLGEGQLEGNVVTCPWHGWQFDVSTGQHCLNSTLQHERFEVTVDGEDVLIRVE